MLHITNEDFYKDIADDVEKWFDTSNYDENDERPLPLGKNKKVPGLFKDELGGKILKELCELRPKAYAYLIDGYDYDDYDDYEKNKIINKKAKGTKKCVIKGRLMLKNYKDCLFNDKKILKSQQRFKSDHHEVHTEEVNKIALSSDDNKRLQTFDGNITLLYGANAFIVCESEMLKVCEAKEKLKMLNGKIRICKAKMKLEMLSKECESEIYVKEKEKCEMFLKNVRAKCNSKMRKYVKIHRK